jgi:hypothetical protein
MPFVLAVKKAVAEQAKLATAGLAQWGESLEPLIAHVAAAGARLVDDSKRLGTKVAEGSVAIAEKHLQPAAIAVKSWSEENGKLALERIEPATLKLKAIADDLGKTIEPHVAPVNAFMERFGQIIKAQWEKLAKELEAPSEAFRALLAQALQCLCLPIQAQRLTYDAVSAEGGEYAPAVVATPPVVAEPVEVV